MSLCLERVVVARPEFRLEVTVELAGRITGIFGPSGAGKTTLLEVIAGLRRAESACVTLDGGVLEDSAAGVWLPPRERGIGYVPQELALFPHLCVKRNLRFGRRSNAAPQFAEEHVLEVLELQGMFPRRVWELSGGERQRVALGRALLSGPRLLLLDEPLASLDARLKERILPFLRRVRDEFRVPIVYVSHDPAEMHTLCESVVVLERGRVARTGPPAAVLPVPA